MSRPLGDIVEALGGTRHGSPDLLIHRLAPLATARPGELAFVAQARYAGQIDTTGAEVLIVPPALEAQALARGACIVTDDPYLYFARLTQWWRQQHETAPPAGIDRLASVHPSASVGEGVSVGPFAVVGRDAQLAAGVRVGGGAIQAAVGRVAATVPPPACAALARDTATGGLPATALGDVRGVPIAGSKRRGAQCRASNIMPRPAMLTVQTAVRTKRRPR